MFVGGVCLTALSIWLMIDPNSIIDLVNQIPSDNEEIPDAFLDIISLVKSVLYFSLVIGILMFLIGFFGCCGSAKQNKCMLNMFSVIVILLMVAEIAAVIMSFVYSPKVDSLMHKRVERYNSTSTDTDDIFNKEFVDQLQTNIHCCGWKSFEDYGTNSTLPETCCEEINCTTPKYREGCKEEIKKGMMIIGGVVIGCVVIELISIMTACIITRKDSRFA